MSPARNSFTTLRLELLAEPARNDLCDLDDRRRPTRADVERPPVGAVLLQSKRAAARDVAHVDEVARLLPVLEDERRTVVEQSRREDCGDAGIGIRQGLPLAVDVEEPERDRGNPVRGSDGEHHLLVVTLADRVDGGRPQRLRLGGRLGLERRSVVRKHVPVTSGELALGPDAGREPGLARLRIPVLALAVDRHRRGDQQLADLLTALDRLLQHHRRADGVDRRVALDLVHRLAHADGRGEVHDGVDTVECAPDRFMVADISDLQLDLAVEVIGPLAGRMNLGVEVVERSNLVALGQKPVGEMRADEAGAAGDENAHDRGAGYLSSGALGLATPRRLSTPRITAPGSDERDRHDEEQEPAGKRRLLVDPELGQEADEERLADREAVDRERHEDDEEEQRAHHVVGTRRELDPDGTTGHPDREHAHRLHAERQQRDPGHQPHVPAKDVHAFVEGAQRPFDA